MAVQSKRGSRGSRGSRAASAKARWYERWFPGPDARAAGQRWAVWLLFLAGVIVLILSALKIKNHVQEDERFSIGNWRLEFGEFPAWVTPEIREEVTSIDHTVEGEPLSLFRKGVLVRLRETLESSPWVSSVSNLRLHYPTTVEPGVIEASLRLRAPVAIIKVSVGIKVSAGGRDFYYLTDGEGLQLGEAYDESPRDWFRIPVITGVDPATVIPRIGDHWKAPDVQEGLEVARVLHEGGIHRDFPDRPIEAIDVSNVAGRLRHAESEVVLFCAGRSLEWGRSPVSMSSRTLDVGEILENLRDVLTRMDEPRYQSVKLFRLYYRQAVYEKG